MIPSYDWRLMQGIACGLMGWRVDDFWRATPVEFWAAWTQWARSKGLDMSVQNVVTREELEALMARFPDLAPA